MFDDKKDESDVIAKPSKKVSKKSKKKLLDPESDDEVGDTAATTFNTETSQE